MRISFLDLENIYLSLVIWHFKEKQAHIQKQQLKNDVKIKITSINNKKLNNACFTIDIHIRSFVDFLKASLSVCLWSLLNVTEYYNLHSAPETILIRITVSKCQGGHCSFDCQNLDFFFFFNICTVSNSDILVILWQWHENKFSSFIKQLKLSWLNEKQIIRF